MTALPRGTCPACGQSAALRRSGVLREHYVYRPQQEQDTSTTLGRVRTCEGSGKLPILTSLDHRIGEQYPRP